MSRQCTVCASNSRRPAIETSLQTVGVQATSRRFEIHESSLRRHQQRHMSATILQEIRASEQIGSTDLIERLVEALDDVSAVRSSALLTGNAGMVLRAANATRELVGVIIHEIGVDATTVAEQLRLGEDLARALVKSTHADPEVGHAVAVTLRALGNLQIADELDQIATTVSKNREREIA